MHLSNELENLAATSTKARVFLARYDKQMRSIQETYQVMKGGQRKQSLEYAKLRLVIQSLKEDEMIELIHGLKVQHAMLTETVQAVIGLLSCVPKNNIHPVSNDLVVGSYQLLAAVDPNKGQFIKATDNGDGHADH